VSSRIDGRRVRMDPALQASVSYFNSASIVIGRADAAVRRIGDLGGRRVAVLAHSVQHRALGDLIASGVAAEPVVVDADRTIDHVARQIEDWAVDAAVVDAHAFAGLRDAHPLLRAGDTVPSEFDYAWTVRARDVELAAAIERFLRSAWQDDAYQVLVQRYFERTRHAQLARLERISPYDDLVRRYADTYDFDWRLIVAQMYQESQFEPNARSSGGARGLMQLLPATAVAMGVGDPFHPADGILGGIRYLDRLRDRFSGGIAPRERIWFALAAYNLGYPQVEIVRRRAERAGLDSTRWFGHVEQMMRVLAAATNGRRYGQTVMYVRAIRSLYNTYYRLQRVHTADIARLAGVRRG
jgi:membrane-bound lytic murein transglycosylase F